MALFANQALLKMLYKCINIDAEMSGVYLHVDSTKINIVPLVSFERYV